MKYLPATIACLVVLAALFITKSAWCLWGLILVHDMIPIRSKLLPTSSDASTKDDQKPNQ